jgi:hypothetical protein
MVKLPQSTLGYAVNGQLVFMPPQRRHFSLPGTHQERTALKRNQKKKRRGDRNAPVKSSGRIHKYCQLQFHPGMAALKNASRVGDLQAAYDAILNEIWNGPPSNASNSRIDHSYRLISQLKSGAAYTSSMEEFSCIVRILTAPNVENRSAIDYAAHCGQAHMLRNYVGLLVLSCLASRNRIKKNIGTLALTFEGWFEYLGYPSGFFNKEALRLCVLNSLNEETKGVFQSNTYTLETILASTKNIMGKAWPFDAESLVNGMVVASKSAKTKTKTPTRPVLRFNDLSREDPHVLLMSDDEEDQSDWGKGDDSGEKDVSLEGYDVVVDGLVMIANDELSYLIDGQDDQIEEAINSDKDTSDSNSSVVILNLQEERENIDESSSTDWSMLSEVSSVVTFESSMVRSFKDALVSNAVTSNITISPAVGVQPHSNRPKLAAIQEKFAKEESSDPAFDSYFMMDGVKGARGGRSARMFKGNSRTCPNGSARRHRLKREDTPRAQWSKRMV